MGDEYDLYGSDIYGGLAPSGSNRGEGSKLAVTSYASGHDLARNGEQQARIEELEAQLNEWTSAFRDASGSTLDGKSSTVPKTLLAEMKKSRAAEKQLQAELTTLRQREQRLHMHLAERDLETVDLRKQLHAARQAADPNIAQVRQLLLDPAVAREFERLRRDAEAKAQEVKALQEELQAVGFSQESKAGRMLMAKCRALQDENEEMGRELAEGKVHGLEQQVALAKGFVEDLRMRYLELEDHTHTLDAEAEDLTRQVVMLKQQVKEGEAAAARGAPRAAGTFPPPPRFNGKPQGGGFTSPRGGTPGWDGPNSGGRLPRHEERKRTYDRESRDDRSSKRSSR